MSDIKPNIFYFYDNLFDKDILENGYEFANDVEPNIAKNLLEKYSKNHNTDIDKNLWFNNLKELAQKEGFCSNMKEYKLNPTSYKGSIADVAGILRVAVTNRQNTPDIYSIMKVMGENKVKERINKVLGR